MVWDDTLVPPWKRRLSKWWSTLKIKNLLLQEQNSPLTVDPVEKEDSNEISRVPLSGGVPIHKLLTKWAGPQSAVVCAPDLRARDHGFKTRSGHILFLLPLVQEGQLSVTGESMCMVYLFTALEV